MRASAWFLIAVIAGCRPSATVENTMPVANLQSYRTVAVRVQSTAFASQGQASFLQMAMVDKLHQQCGFQQIDPASGTRADVVLDLNITNRGRGGGGWVVNENVATIETLLVLTDGDGELLGTARIRGKSSGVLTGNTVPENEAIDEVAKAVVGLLAKSGCSGPRIARALPPEPPAPVPDQGSATSPVPTGPDAKTLADAEALNEQGKTKLFGANIPGAVADFQAANALVPDARYVFNVCIALGAQEQWDNAIAACRQAKGMNPKPTLVTKIDARLDLLQHHQ